MDWKDGDVVFGPPVPPLGEEEEDGEESSPSGDGRGVRGRRMMAAIEKERKREILGSDAIERLTLDAIRGAGPSIPGKDAEEFYRLVRADIAEMAEDGFIPDMPNDYGDL